MIQRMIIVISVGAFLFACQELDTDQQKFDTDQQELDEDQQELYEEDQQELYEEDQQELYEDQQKLDADPQELGICEDWCKYSPAFTWPFIPQCQGCTSSSFYRCADWCMDSPPQSWIFITQCVDCEQ